MGRRPEVDVWAAIAAGDAERMRELLRKLPKSWIQQQGASAASLAQAKGHAEISKLLRAESAEALATDDRATRLGDELRAKYQPVNLVTKPLGPAPARRRRAADHNHGPNGEHLERDRNEAEPAPVAQAQTPQRPKPASAPAQEKPASTGAYPAK